MLCECGCGKPIKTPDAKGRTRRFVLGHSRRNYPELGGRFWSKVKKPAAVDECWLWVGATVRGYGEFYFKGRQLKAHRFAYELLVGPIPEGLTIDHLCRNRSCINPSHMEPVTIQENLRRGISPSAVNARKTHCLRGHPLKGQNLLVNNGHRHCRQCKKEQDSHRAHQVQDTK